MIYVCVYRPLGPLLTPSIAVERQLAEQPEPQELQLVWLPPTEDIAAASVMPWLLLTTGMTLRKNVTCLWLLSSVWTGSDFL